MFFAGMNRTSYQWYLEPTREDDDPHSPFSSRVSDALTGADSTSYQMREPIEDDQERLAMKRVEMPLPLPMRVANPRVREDREDSFARANS